MRSARRNLTTLERQVLAAQKPKFSSGVPAVSKVSLYQSSPSCESRYDSVILAGIAVVLFSITAWFLREIQFPHTMKEIILNFIAPLR